MMKKIPLPKLKQGDILLYRDGNSPITKLIRLFTTSDYNHASIYLGNNYVAESLARGFSIRKYEDMNYSLNHGVDVFRFRRKNFDSKKVKFYVLKYLGRKYGFIDLLKIVLNILTKITFKKESKRLICSEAVALVYRKSGFELFPKRKNLDYVTPADISNCKLLKKIW